MFALKKICDINDLRKSFIFIRNVKIVTFGTKLDIDTVAANDLVIGVVGIRIVNASNIVTSLDQSVFIVKRAKIILFKTVIANSSICWWLRKVRFPLLPPHTTTCLKSEVYQNVNFSAWPPAYSTVRTAT